MFKVKTSLESPFELFMALFHNRGLIEEIYNAHRTEPGKTKSSPKNLYQLCAQACNLAFGEGAAEKLAHMFWDIKYAEKFG